MDVWAVIAAAGYGKRMGQLCAQTHKTSLLIADTPMLYYAARYFVTHPHIAGVVIVESCKTPLPFPPDSYMHVQGGEQRFNSVLAGLNAVLKQNTNAYALIHDGARPNISKADIDLLMRWIRNNPQHACALGAPATDSLVDVDENLKVHDVVDRSTIWRTFTPQCAPAALLRNSIQHCIAQQYAVTDDVSALHHCGHAVTMIEGKQDNIKVTTPIDLSLAESILSA